MAENDRFSDPIGFAPLGQCGVCKHYEYETATCAAFPGGIPEEILKNEWDHHRAWPDGDNGVKFIRRYVSKAIKKPSSVRSS